MNTRRTERQAQDGESISRVTARILQLLEEERVLIDRLSECRITVPNAGAWRHPESNLWALEARRS